jgi:hypothetical protein
LELARLPVVGMVQLRMAGLVDPARVAVNSSDRPECRIIRFCSHF